MPERAAIVTGASSGIGLAIARILGEEGYGITMAARRPEKLEGAVAGLAADGFDVHGVAANVADESEIQKVVAAHRERYGRLDVLVNNAGVGVGATVGEIETKRLDMQLDINIRSNRALLPRVRFDAAAGRRRAPQRAGGQHLVDLRQARRGLAVGVFGDQARRRRLDRSDEQGNRQAGRQVDGAVPGLRRHADDRLRQGPGSRQRR